MRSKIQRTEKTDNIKTRISIPYGHTCLTADVRNACVLTSGTKALKSELTGDELVRRAMDDPIASPALSDLAIGRKTCTIIISDHTRPVPSRDILPEMLKDIRKNNPDIEITLLVATGCHRITTGDELREKVGDDIFRNEHIVVHDCDKNNVDIGVLPSGAHLIIDRLAAETGLLVAEGFIEPHFFAGFSGGRKSVLPGICGRKTVLGNHCGAFIDSQYARTGILENNPIHKDMIAAAKMAGLKYIVNVVIDENHKTAAAFAGDPIEAHKAGTDFLMGYARVKAEPADVCITGNGGAPLDQNVYQCVKSMTAAEAATGQGGIIILCAECADGVGGEHFYKQLCSCSGPEELYDSLKNTPQDETAPDAWQSQVLARVLRDRRVIFVTRPELKDTIISMKMLYAPDLQSAIEQAEKMTEEDRTVNVIPDGISVIVDNSVKK